MDIITKHFEELTVTELYEILKLRSAVFVVEQSCIYQDIDDTDKTSLHIFIKEENALKAYLRTFSRTDKQAQIGRVVSAERGKSYGLTVMKAGISAAKELLKKESVYIEAQVYAIPFYKRLGFKTTSDEFLEDGIPHIKMELAL